MSSPVWKYSEVRDQVRDGDVVAVEGRGLIGRAIRLGTGGTVTHVGVAWWIDGSLFLWESREFRGAQLRRMSLAVEEAGELLFYGLRDRGDFCGRWGANAEPEQLATARAWCLRQLGYGYNWRGIGRWVRRVLRRWVLLPELRAIDDTLQDGHRYCSQGASAAWRLMGSDLRPDLADEETSPADVAASPVLELVLVVASAVDG